MRRSIKTISVIGAWVLLVTVLTWLVSSLSLPLAIVLETSTNLPLTIVSIFALLVGTFFPLFYIIIGPALMVLFTATVEVFDREH